MFCGIQITLRSLHLFVHRCTQPSSNAENSQVRGSTTVTSFLRWLYAAFAFSSHTGFSSEFIVTNPTRLRIKTSTTAIYPKLCMVSNLMKRRVLLSVLRILSRRITELSSLSWRISNLALISSDRNLTYQLSLRIGSIFRRRRQERQFQSLSFRLLKTP